ncbi:MAG: phosphoribosylformylglycinamidine synthase subunit PurQ [Candidatus Micrarchaeia archaeon]
MKRKKVIVAKKKVAPSKREPSRAVPAKASLRAAPKAEPRPPKCLVLSGFGLNSEMELAHAFSLAGADSKIVHFSDISSGETKLEDFQIFAIPGGWSFADDISSGRVLANKLKSTFRGDFEAFVTSGKPMLGICNGFQVLAKLGALPNMALDFSQEATLSNNASGRFEDRWVNLKPQKSACKYFEGVDFINCPVRHGEGRFICRDSAVLSQLEKKGQVALKYVDGNMKEGDYPINPNGAVKNIAAISDTTGKILGMMPHPECSVYRSQFPRWTAGISHEKNSRRFFSNIVEEGKKYI